MWAKMTSQRTLRIKTTPTKTKNLFLLSEIDGLRYCQFYVAFEKHKKDF